VSDAEPRHLEWEGSFNVRDLGGLRTTDGGETRRRSVVRADDLSGLTAAGWRDLSGYGIRTVIDLRNDDEVTEDAAPRPAEVTTIRLPLDVSEDREFWDVWESGPQFATPLYYGPHLKRFPERTVRVVSAVARADSGGVAFHCVGGRDRTGQIAMVLLALIGADPDEIAADYALSTERLTAKYAARGEEDQGRLIQEFLGARGTTAERLIVETVEQLDLERLVLEGGLSRDDLRALRLRLLSPAP
jgi:protein-tyrosine phosphatase